jgi:hypothetical protein
MFFSASLLVSILQSRMEALARGVASLRRVHA